jgi:hypothetical protein
MPGAFDEEWIREDERRIIAQNRASTSFNTDVEDYPDSFACDHINTYPEN